MKRREFNKCLLLGMAAAATPNVLMANTMAAQKVADAGFIPQWEVAVYISNAEVSPGGLN